MGCVRTAKAVLRYCTCAVLLSENVRKYIYMMKKISRRSFLQVCSITAATATLTACGGTKTETAKKDGAHEAVTFMAPYKEIEAFIEQVHSVYPEVNIEVVPYSGDNTTTCLQNMFAAGDLPDVCTLTYYDPRIDLVSDKLLDLSGYDFTDNYVESRLQDVFDNGAIYLLPSTYNCYGITYNKTLLKKYGWELPNSFAELEELAAKAKEAGVDLCLPQIQYPGYGFQYLCNIADADFLGTLDGRPWQQDYLSGKANVSNTPGMMQAMDGLEATRRIRSGENPLGRIIPILAMTANAFLEDMQKSKEAGMDEHLSKPVDIAALEQTVKRFRVTSPIKK